MGHFSILTINHDYFTNAINVPDLRERLYSTVMGHDTFHGVIKNKFRNDTLPGFDLAYTAHADFCPVLAFSHGYIKGVVGEVIIRAADEKSLDDYLVAVAKQRGFVIYKKGEK